jgi:hypothetical protein
MTDLEQGILEIIRAQVGNDRAMTQKDITDKWNNSEWNSCYIYHSDEEKNIDTRRVRKIIANLINQGYPIVSTPSNGGGYFWQERPEEGLECARRLRRQAVKLFLKARRIRSNSRTGQMELGVRY